MVCSTVETRHVTRLYVEITTGIVGTTKSRCNVLRYLLLYLMQLQGQPQKATPTQNSALTMARTLISFDWAMKHLLRRKTNFRILEGFLSELLHEDIKILDVLESESNKETKDDKLNRVDLKVKDSQNRFIIIELQYYREYDFFQRMLFGTSKVITEHQQEGETYGTVSKVISVNILNFSIGEGEDYIYYGKTEFVGMHTRDILKLDAKQQEIYKTDKIASLFPEYYIIRVKQFNSITKDRLDEWIYFLKNEEIPNNFKAKGIQQAKKSFSVLKMDDTERRAYDRYQDSLRDIASWHETYVTVPFMDGKAEGLAEGLAEGKAKGLAEGMERGMQKGKAEGLLEGMEKGMEKGMERGMEKGKAEGLAEGIEKGLMQGKLEIARRLLANGMSKNEAAALAGVAVEAL